MNQDLSKKTLILASSSKNRFELLKRLVADFLVINPDTDETELKNESAKKLVIRLGKAKAKEGLNSYLKTNKNNINEQIWVIGSDQVLEVEKQIFGKPLSEQKAIEQLSFFSEKIGIFHTSLCLIYYQNGIERVLNANVKTKIAFAKITLDEIKSYLDKENALFCVGSFKSEGIGVCLLNSIKSSDHSAVIGLPLIKLNKMLKKTGFFIL